MYCPICREPGRYPWQHSEKCVEGLRHRIRWYEAGIPVLLVLLAAETVLLIIAFIMLGRCG
jgi:hypothetical protein